MRLCSRHCLKCAAPVAGNAAETTAAMTPEAVEKALDEVRPYLIADGGNVEVSQPASSSPYFTIISGRILEPDAPCTSQRWVPARGMHSASKVTAGGTLGRDAWCAAREPRRPARRWWASTAGQ